MRYRPKVSPDDAMRIYRKITGDDETEQTDEVVTVLRAVLYATVDDTAIGMLCKQNWFDGSRIACELAAIGMRRMYEKEIRRKNRV
jgi:hypothetical protein